MGTYGPEKSEKIRKEFVFIGALHPALSYSLNPSNNLLQHSTELQQDFEAAVVESTEGTSSVTTDCNLRQGARHL